jgi:hypothetical protein
MESAKLSEVRIKPQAAIYFASIRSSLPENTAGSIAISGANGTAENFYKTLYVS